MKKTMKYFSMAALALVGAVMTSCSSDDFTENNQQFAENNGNNVETLTASISMAGDETRALDAEGHKTFSVGDKIAVVYKNTSGTTVKAESEELEAGDITNEGKSADFTVTLTNADKTQNVTYIYPAAMAGEDGSVASISSQNGTLESLASNMDYCKFSGAWDGSDLPTGEMDNQLVICAFTLKDCLGTNDITSTITNMTVSDGTNTYNVTRDAAAGPIYVAIYPTSSQNINYTATAGTTFYAKAVENKTYAAGSWHNIGLKMAEVVSGKFTVNASGDKVYFSKSNLQAEATYVDENTTTWKWHFANTQYARVGEGANIYINGNGKVSSAGNEKNVDLFGWSTKETYLGINSSTSNDDYSDVFVDWGSHADVIAGIGSGWRTLTSDEWRYLMVTRAGNRFAMASIGGTRGGIILLPDNWKTSYYTLSNINDATKAFTTNTITAANWTSKLEAHGAVFLPVTGHREGTTVSYSDERLYYWSATGTTATNANQMYSYVGTLAPDAGGGRHWSNAVRLVYDIK